MYANVTLARLLSPVRVWPSRVACAERAVSALGVLCLDDFEFSDFEANVTWVASATDKVVAEASPGEPPRIGLLVGEAPCAH